MIRITDIQELVPADDGFLVAMADSEFNFAINQAKALHDFTCGMAVDLFGHGSKQHCDAVDRARNEYAAARTAAHAARSIRINELRDAIRRETPKLQVVA